MTANQEGEKERTVDLHAMTDEDARKVIRAHNLTQPAVDEARSADQRATAIAAVASLGASLSPAGAALLLDVQKWKNPSGMRTGFGVVLLLSVTCFLIAAFLSLTTHRLMSPHRELASPKPSREHSAKQEEQPIEDGLKAGWQAAKDKHDRAVQALWALVAGLLFVWILTLLALLGAP
jgi:hypothetical protein